MKVKELINKLSKFDGNMIVQCFSLGGGDNVVDVIDIDEQGNKTNYPTIRYGEVDINDD